MKKALKFLFLTNYGRVLFGFVLVMLGLWMIELDFYPDIFYYVEIIGGGILAVHIIVGIFFAFVINPIRRWNNRKY